MLTRNFYNNVMAYLTGKTILNGTLGVDGTYSNTVPQAAGYKFMSAFQYMSSSNGSTGTYFGTGTTPSTIDDYKVESWLNTSTQITVTNPSDFSFSVEAGALVASATFGVTNKTSAAIPVSEICYVAMLYTGTSSSSTKPALVDRTVLEEPIVINPGESKQLTYTIRMNYPTV